MFFQDFAMVIAADQPPISYQDNASANGRTLPDKKYTNTAMTVELCAQTAKTYKYKYFGLEYGECLPSLLLGFADRLV